MRFTVLGAVTVRVGEEPIAVGGPKPRALLAMLLLNPNRVIPRDTLVEGLWGESLPASAAHSLDHYVSRLRKALGNDRIIRQSPGYLIRVEPGELDLERFEQLREAGRAQLRAGDPEAAAATLSGALALFEGIPLADVLYEPFAADAARRLVERRLLAIEDRVECDLECGLAGELVSELEQLAHEHPFEERVLGQLMIALYRAGRQADALAVFQSARRRLATELGLEPGPELREIETGILRHDEALAGKRRRAQPRRSTTRWAAALGLAATAASLAIAVLLIRDGPSSSTGLAEGANSNRLVALTTRSGSIVLSDAPVAVVARAGSLWTADANDHTISRVDPNTRSVIDRIPVSATPSALAVGGGAIWAATTVGGAIFRIDPSTDTVTQVIRLGGASPAAIALDDGKLWAADATDKALLEIDADTGALSRTFTLDLAPTALTVSSGKLWVASYDGGTAEEIDPHSGATLARVTVGQGPAAIAATPGAIWVANSLDGTVTRIDSQTAIVVATVAVGNGPTALTVADGSVWVGNTYSSTVARLDEASGRILRTIVVGGRPSALAVIGQTPWVGAAALGSGHRGGTLVLVTVNPFETVDPALYDGIEPSEFSSFAYDTLVTFERVSGPQGLHLVPDLALSLPQPADGGLSYAFRLRSSVRYSDGRSVLASDFRRAFERLFRLHSSGAAHYKAIVGAPSCLRAPAHCRLTRGIVTDDRAGTIVFRLRTPDPDFLYELTSFAFTAPIPPGVPDQIGSNAVPGTGPYRIVSVGKEIRFTRNPYFREWSHAAQPDGNPDVIVWRLASSHEAVVQAIEQGRADWTYDLIPPRQLRRLQVRRPALLHATPWFLVQFVPLNSRKAPFNDVRVRRALNFAVDRAKVVRMYGGSAVAAPLCQPLAPGLLGYRRYCPYTQNPATNGRWSAPDLVQARRLVEQSGTRGEVVDVWGTTDELAIPAELPAYIARVLRSLGYRTRLHTVPFASLTEHKRRNIQLSIDGDWLPDYPAPSSYIPEFFACDGSLSNHYFCDPKLDDLMAQANAIQISHPHRAAELWKRVDHRLTDEAAWLPLVNPSGVDLVSRRIRNYQFHPVWGFLADQVWLH